MNEKRPMEEVMHPTEQTILVLESGPAILLTLLSVLPIIIDDIFQETLEKYVSELLKRCIYHLSAPSETLISPSLAIM